VTTIIITALAVLSALLFGLLSARTSKLRKTQERLDSKSIELSATQAQLEAIHEIRERIGETEKEQPPEKTKAPADGDSDARLARLNSLSDTMSDGNRQ
jgi:hypothetical protein